VGFFPPYFYRPSRLGLVATRRCPATMKAAGQAKRASSWNSNGCCRWSQPSSFVISSRPCKLAVMGIQKATAPAMIRYLIISIVLGLTFLTLIVRLLAAVLPRRHTIFGRLHTLTASTAPTSRRRRLHVRLPHARNGRPFLSQNHEAIEAASFYWHSSTYLDRPLPSATSSR